MEVQYTYPSDHRKKGSNTIYRLAKYHHPLSAIDQERVVSAFGLPAPTSWALSTQFSHFQRYSQSTPRDLGQYPDATYS